MRERKHFIGVWLDDKEYNHLNQLCAKSGLSTSAVLRQILSGTQLRPRPPDQYTALLRELSAIGNNSQDCLYLNVFAPEHRDGPLPVMVWIYGGSYSQGGAGAELPGTTQLQYDFTRFARETGCVVVSFNYRLNLYGFLNLHFLDESFEQNNGLYDQIMALRFVRDNIAVFGGDPENVTLFGQSAGGACILALMTMPEAKDLFHKAIVQSACIEHFFTEEESRAHTKTYLRLAGVKAARELLSLPPQKVMDTNRKYAGTLLRKGDIRCAFSPVIDGVTLRDAPKKAAKRSPIPLLIGNVSQEANLFLHAIPSVALPFAARFLRLKVSTGSGSYRQLLYHHADSGDVRRRSPDPQPFQA